MDCVLSHLPPSVGALVDPYVSALSTESVQWVAVALLSLIAIYAGFLYIRSAKEAAVAFNVPVPPEVRKSDAILKRWEDASGLEKQVLEGQVRGVSIPAK